MRVGIGYDVHRLRRGRKLILGGIEIPFDKGLEGHSDADVLTHALCDAILGAGGLGDIGMHFPDSDPQFKDISSIFLLERVNEMIRQQGYAVLNADTIIVAERPKIQPYRDRIRDNLSKSLNIKPNCINIKATTTEGIGMMGKGEGIGAMCVVMIGSAAGDKGHVFKNL
jgi:2-C-methyl-D-erythritol 2,4-cyclodiphosphate synthase